MTTTEPMTEEAALWASIGEMPECQLRRGVAADWFEERSGKVECPNCAPPRAFPPYAWKCPTCQGTGYIPDRNGRMAAALRATADRVPRWIPGDDCWNWWQTEHQLKMDQTGSVWSTVYAILKIPTDYDTATAAIRNLCEAYIVVHFHVQNSEEP